MPPPRAPGTHSDTAPVLRTRRRSTGHEAARIARRERRLARYEEVIARYEQGASMREIADVMHLSRWQVQRFVKASTFPEQAPRTRPEYRAKYTVVPEDIRSHTAAVCPLPAPRQLVWLLLKDSKQLNAEETHVLEQLRQQPTVEQAYTLGQQFVEIVRQRQHDAFDGWLAACQASGIPDLQGFAAGLKQDEAAVRAALTMNWSNGQVEGQNTRLKMLKRQMYGRAGFALLRKRVLHAA